MLYNKFFSLITRKDRKEIPFLIFLIIIGMFLEALTISLLVPAIGFITQKDFYHKLPPSIASFAADYSQVDLIFMGFAILLLTYAIKSVYLLYLMNRQNKFAFGLEASLSSFLFKEYLRQPLIFHLQKNSAEMMHYVNNESRILISSVLLPFLTLVSELSVFIGTVSLLVYLKPLESSIVIVFFTVVAVLYNSLTRKKSASLGKIRHELDGVRLLNLKQGLSCIKEIKSLQRESYFGKAYHNCSLARSNAEVKFKFILDAPRLLLELVTVIGLVVLVFLLLHTEKLENILPVVVLFSAVAFRLLPSVNRVINSINTLQYAKKTINSLSDQMALLKKYKSSDSDEAFAFNQELTLDKVSFTYPEANKLALNNITMNIPRGNCIGIYGESGAGKSTLVDIILGLFSPQEGSIKVDGTEVKTNLRGWQRNVGYIPQQIHLIDDSIRRNVAFGIPDDLIDDELVLKSLNGASLKEFVLSLSQGINTLVGEDGVRISGGQRQRIGIARALYNNSQILVLDEATSALDVSTESEVMRAVYKIRGYKTVIIVTHRLSSLRYCDQIYKITSGKLSADTKLVTEFSA